MNDLVFFEAVTAVFEVVGVGAMVVGIVVAVVISVRVWLATKSGPEAFRTLRETIGMVILLGLEILVAADLVKTVTSTPSLTDAAVLGLIVLIRTVLSFSLQVEIEGIVPWKRALLTSPQLMKRAFDASRPAASAAAPTLGDPLDTRDWPPTSRD